MREVYRALAALEEEGKSGVLCTIINADGSTPRSEGSKMLVYPDGSIVGSVGGGEVEGRIIQQALELLSSGQTKVVAYNLIDPQQGDPGVCGGAVEVFIEPVYAPDELLVIGGGHVGQAVVHLGKWLGFRVILSDDRPEYCTPQSAPGADVYLPCEIDELPSRFEFSDRTSVVLATRNMQVDTSGLPEILSEPSAYVGVISSQRRWALTREELLNLGVDPAAVDRVYAPIGLDLKAETPEEIALSIMAEVVMTKQGGRGRPLSQKKK